MMQPTWIWRNRQADSTLRVEGQGQEGQGPGAWLGSAGDWCGAQLISASPGLAAIGIYLRRRSLKILGEDPIVGPFSALLSFRRDLQDLCTVKER
jgi:hypothetical protein